MSNIICRPTHSDSVRSYGAIQVLRNAVRVGGDNFPGKKRYEGVRFNIIGVTRGVGGGQISGKKVLHFNGPYVPISYLFLFNLDVISQANFFTTKFKFF